MSQDKLPPIPKGYTLVKEEAPPIPEGYTLVDSGKSSVQVEKKKEKVGPITPIKPSTTLPPSGSVVPSTSAEPYKWDPFYLEKKGVVQQKPNIKPVSTFSGGATPTPAEKKAPEKTEKDKVLEYFNIEFNSDPDLYYSADTREELYKAMYPKLKDAGFDVASQQYQAIRDEAEKMWQDAYGLQQYQKLLKEQPNNPNAQYGVATYLMNTGKNEDATKMYETLIAEHPSYLPAYNGLAYIYGNRGNNMMAIDYMDRAIEQAPDDASLWNNRAIYKQRVGDIKGAIEDINMGLTKTEDKAMMAELIMQRAKIYGRQAGDDSLAKKYIKALAGVDTVAEIAERELFDEMYRKDYTEAVRLHKEAAIESAKKGEIGAEPLTIEERMKGWVGSKGMSEAMDAFINPNNQGLAGLVMNPIGYIVGTGVEGVKHGGEEMAKGFKSGDPIKVLKGGLDAAFATAMTATPVGWVFTGSMSGVDALPYGEYINKWFMAPVSSAVEAMGYEPGDVSGIADIVIQGILMHKINQGSTKVMDVAEKIKNKKPLVADEMKVVQDAVNNMDVQGLKEVVNDAGLKKKPIEVIEKPAKVIEEKTEDVSKMADEPQKTSETVPFVLEEFKYKEGEIPVEKRKTLDEVYEKEDIDNAKQIIEEGWFNLAGRVYEARPDFELSTYEITKAIKDIKAGKNSVPARKLIEKIKPIIEKGFIPMLRETEGMTERFGINLNEARKMLEKERSDVSELTPEEKIEAKKVPDISNIIEADKVTPETFEAWKEQNDLIFNPDELQTIKEYIYERAEQERDPLLTGEKPLGEGEKLEEVKGIEGAKSARELAQERLKESGRILSEKFKDIFNEELGIIHDPKREAQKLYDFHVALVEAAKDAIKLGVVSAKEFADHIGRRVDDFLERAWDDAYNQTKGYDPFVVSAEFFEKMSVKRKFYSKEDAKAAEIKRANEKIKYDNENPSIQLKEETWVDKLATAFQNRFHRLGQTQKALEKTGVEIYDEINAEVANELTVGRIKAKLDRLENEIVKSKAKGEKALFERAKEEGVDAEDIGLYMYAKHAPERNAKVAADRREEYNAEKGKIEEKRKEIDEIKDPEEKARQEARLNAKEKELEKMLMDDGGSGMTNQQAKEILQEYELTGKTAYLEKYANEFREKVIDKNLEELKDSGLITEEAYNEIKDGYKHYVPLLVGEKMEGKILGKGKSIDLKGKDIYRAKGSNLYSSDQRINPVFAALFNYQKSIIRSEQNRTNRTFLRFAEKVGEPIFKIRKPEYNVKVNQNGEVEYVYRNYDPKLSENSIELKIDGKPVLIEISDPALLKAMKGIGVVKGVPILQSVNSFLRNVNTVLNPEFVLSNFIRDIQTALGNLSAEDIDKIKRNTVKNIPNAAKGIWQNERGKKSEWSDIVQELKDEGGDISWLQIGDINEYASKIEKKINRYNSNKTADNAANMFNSIVDYYISASKVAEMSVRVSAYKAARDAGVSPMKAAYLAKNLTVNFEKKGNLGAAMDSLYLFANAGIQGNARMFLALGKSKKTRALVASGVAGSMMMNYMNSLINEEEYDKIDDVIKERNIIIMKTDGDYIKIPLPYGYNIFKVMGDSIYEMISGKKDVSEGIKKIFLSISNAFNPLSSPTLSQMISPTITDPLVQLSENKNWRGAPIIPETKGFQPGTKESSKYFSSVRPLSKEVTDWLNDVTGGTKTEAGYIDISPEILDHFIDFMGGGLSRFVMNVLNGTYEFAKGDIPKMSNIPFARTFYGKPSEYRDTKIVYEMLDNSYKKIYDEDEILKFKKSIQKAVDEKQIEHERAKDMTSTFIKGQKMLKFSRENPELTLDEIKKRYK